MHAAARIYLTPLVVAACIGCFSGRVLAQAATDTEAPTTTPDAAEFLATQSPADREVASRLAAELQRAATQLLAAEDITVETLAAARELAIEAAGLDPNNLELWHWVVGVAGLNDDARLREFAIRRIMELDPTDEGARFDLLSQAIDAIPTADDRVAAYEQILSDQNLAKLSPAARSRVALDYALLERRRGNSSAFAELLTQALEIDSANRDAAALAAGYFQANSSDAHGTAELLINVLLADPTDISVQVELARLMLEHGAYDAASKLYELANQGLEANQQEPDGNFLADLAVAQWAAGDSRGALDTITGRQHMMDSRYRVNLRRERPELTTAEVMSAHAPLPVTLSVVRAAIHEELNNEEQATAVNALISDYDAALTTEGPRLQMRFTTLPQAEQDALAAELDETGADPDRPNRIKMALGKVALEKAMMLLWLNGDMGAIEQTMAAVEERLPVSELAKSRFDGWRAYRQGEIEEAQELLTSVGEDDAPARLGLALIAADAGRSKDAARHYLAVARSQPGSVMAVWSVHRLEKMLGRTFPLSDQAAALQVLAESIPQRIFRSASNSTMTVDVIVKPVKDSFTPFEPILINIKISNATGQPLWITDDGPIRRQIAVLPTLRMSDLPQVAALKPIIVDIGRKLRLEPRESIEMTLDVRRSEVGGVLKQVPLSSGIITVEVLSNFVVRSDGVILSGLYGGSGKTQFRIIGENPNDEWLESVMQQLSAVDSVNDIENVSGISSMLLMVNDPAQRKSRGIADRAVPKVDGDLADRAKLAMVEAFRKMPPTWASLALLTVTSSEEVEELRAIARNSEDHFVLLAYVWSHLKDLQDPVLASILRSDDLGGKIIAYGVAKRYEAQVRREEELARRRAGTSDITSGR